MKIILETIAYTCDKNYKERLENLGFKCSEYFKDSFEILTDSIEIEINTIEELMKLVEEASPPSPHHLTSLDSAVLVGNGKIILYDGYVE